MAITINYHEIYMKFSVIWVLTVIINNLSLHNFFLWRIDDNYRLFTDWLNFQTITYDNMIIAYESLWCPYKKKLSEETVRQLVRRATSNHD